MNGFSRFAGSALFVGLVVLGVLVLSGCAVGPFTGGREVRFRSVERPVELDPEPPYIGYAPISETQAHIVLTDIPPEILADDERLARTPGQLIHVTMFLRPSPGATPIASSAVTATVRYVVLSEGAAGVYAGGGFLLPGGKPGGDKLSGRMPDATLRLAASTEGFEDLIGRGVMDLRFRAKRDEDLVGLVRRVTDRVQLAAYPVEGSLASELAQ